jgi:hypothetical protein
MEVVYSSEGRPTLHISARLPFEGETLDDILFMYAPIAYWEELERPVEPPPLSQGELTYVPPAPPTPTEAAYAKRDILLQQSDWTQLPDVPLTEAQRQAWVAYRQSLRDVPQQPGFPDNIVWPVAPDTQNSLPVTEA